MLRIPRTETVSYGDFLKKRKERKRTVIMLKKRQIIFLGYIMRKDGLEYLTLTLHIKERERESNA